MANIVTSSDTLTFDTVTAAFSDGWLETQPIEQSQQKNTLLGMMQKKEKKAHGGKMRVNVSAITTKTGEGAFVKGTPLTPTDEDDVTTATFRRAVYRTNATVFVHDIIDNDDPRAFFKIVGWKLMRARQRMNNVLQVDLWATTTVAVGLQGIPMMIPDDGGLAAGAYGGLTGSAALQAFWLAASDAAGYTISTGLMDAIDSISYTLEAGGARDWDYAFTHSTVHKILRQYHRDFGLITDPRSQAGKRAADLGYGVLEYNGKAILWDRSVPSTTATTGHRFYMFSDDSFYLGSIPGWNFKTMPWRWLPTQEGKTTTVIWAGQAICKQRRGLGVISALSV